MLEKILNRMRDLFVEEAPNCRDVMLHPVIMAMSERERADLPLSAAYQRPAECCGPKCS